jgi:hypothetical protein
VLLVKLSIRVTSQTVSVAALKNLDDEVDINGVWEAVK